MMDKIRYSIVRVVAGLIILAPLTMEPGYCQSVKQNMDKAVADLLAEKKIPGAIVGVWSPSLGTWIKSFGKADIGKGREMHWDKKMRIGSVTQTYLVTLLLELTDERKVNLDDKVSKYLSFVPNGNNITVRQLANNTSGLFNYMDDDNFKAEVKKSPLRGWQPVELANIAFSHAPYSNPGEGWHASDTNFVLLGMIIEKATSEPLQDTLKEKVLEKIGFANTVFATGPFISGDYSRGYLGEKNSIVPQDITFLDPSVMWASGAIVSDLGDLSLWVKSLAGGSLLTDKSKAARFNWIETDQPGLKFGLGVSKVGDYVGYSGGIPGYSCAMFYLPSRDVTIIVLLNKFPDDDAANLIFKALAKIILPDSAL
ncbi:MAG: serine hydrolase domain-containing protein [Candidatus Omnitrophota bacterium]